jgi:hypothetical protein
MCRLHEEFIETDLEYIETLVSASSHLEALINMPLYLLQTPEAGIHAMPCKFQ